MLRSLGDFISEITGGARDPARFEETDYRLAAAALLVHVATTDANFDEQERARLREVLAERFELGGEEADARTCSSHGDQPRVGVTRERSPGRFHR